jgi:hypothetical protein
MKIKLLLGLLPLTLLLLSNSSNPPNRHTGAPPNEPLCSNCHSPNLSIQGSVEIIGLPESIQPGMSYDITVRSTSTGGPANRAGFQLVVLNQMDMNIGTFSNAGPNVGFESSGGRTYAEHRNPRALNNGTTDFTFTWTAPAETNATSVGFYAVSLLANGNGNSSGDRAVVTDVEIPVEQTNSAAEIPVPNPIQLYPNPANHTLWIESDFAAQSSQIEYHILNSTGQPLTKGYLPNGDTSGIDINALPSGFYLIQFLSDGVLMTRTFIKL